MKELPLTQGYFAIVDNDDYEEQSKYKWQATPSGKSVIATRMVYSGPMRVRRMVCLHHEVMGVSNSQERTTVTNRNGNRLDCRKSNLVIGHSAAITKGPRLIARNTSGYRGVSWFEQSRKWKAQFEKDSKGHYLGLFDTPEAAARAYDRAVREAFGELATTNFD